MQQGATAMQRHVAVREDKDVIRFSGSAEKQTPQNSSVTLHETKLSVFFTSISFVFVTAQMCVALLIQQ